MAIKKILNKICSRNILTRGKKLYRVYSFLGLKLKYRISETEYYQTKEYKEIFEKLSFEILEILKPFDKITLFFDHSLGGGTEFYYKNLLRFLKDNEAVLRLQYFPKQKYYKLSLNANNSRYKEIFGFELKDIVKHIKNVEFKEIIINNIIGYPSVKEIFDTASSLKKQHPSIRTRIMIHDYFSICPNYKLLDTSRKCCDGKYDKNRCKKCIKRLNPLLTPIEINKNTSMENWQNIWRKFISSNVDEIRCFSEAAKRIVQNIYTEQADKITIVPHKFIPFKNSIRVATIGVMTPHKGSEIINALGDYIKENNIWDTEIFVFGEDNKKIENSEYIHLKGEYLRGELPQILKQNDIDLIFIPSVWNETFSYTAQEAIALNYPVICFDLGGQADQVKNYEKGRIIESFEPSDIYKIIKLVYEETNKDYLNEKTLIGTKQ